MTYLDTSVALAHLLEEDKAPPESLWSRDLVASRLLNYELWARLRARGIWESHGELARQVVGVLLLLDLVDPVLERAL